MGEGPEGLPIRRDHQNEQEASLEDEGEIVPAHAQVLRKADRGGECLLIGTYLSQDVSLVSSVALN